MRDVCEDSNSWPSIIDVVKVRCEKSRHLCGIGIRHEKQAPDTRNEIFAGEGIGDTVVDQWIAGDAGITEGWKVADEIRDHIEGSRIVSLHRSPPIHIRDAWARVHLQGDRC